MSNLPSKSFRVGNDDKQVVSFNLHDAKRISVAVVKSEQERRQNRKSVLPRAVPAASIVLATFTGAWALDQEKTVRLQEDTNTTVIAKNVFHPNIGFSPASRICGISGSTLVMVRC